VKSCFILNAHITQKDWDPLSLKSAEFRRATTNMRFCYQTVSELIAPFREHLNKVTSDRIGFYLGTSHGELEPTVEFLKNLTPTTVANPIHFQNSLHNSMLGFLTQTLKFASPGITSTNHYFSGESALLMAQGALQTGEIDFAIVIGCDTIPMNLKAPYLSHYNECTIATQIKSGAASLLLCSQNGLSLLSDPVQPLTELITIRCHYQPKMNIPNESELSEFYDSNAIEEISKQLHLNNSECELKLLKPNGQYSVTQLRTCYVL